MGAFDRRLAKLEANSPRAELSPHAKQWLGPELSPEEAAELDRHVIDVDFDEVDWTKHSPEVRTWLQRD